MDELENLKAALRNAPSDPLLDGSKQSVTDRAEAVAELRNRINEVEAELAGSFILGRTR